MNLKRLGSGRAVHLLLLVPSQVCFAPRPSSSMSGENGGTPTPVVCDSSCRDSVCDLPVLPSPPLPTCAAPATACATDDLGETVTAPDGEVVRECDLAECRGSRQVSPVRVTSLRTKCCEG